VASLVSVLVEVVGRVAPADGVAWLTQQLVFDEPGRAIPDDVRSITRSAR
jgi:hypothetical protein